MVEIRDFQTAGVVSFARVCPFYAQKPGRMEIMGKRVGVKGEYWENCVDSVQALVDELTANVPPPAWPEDFPAMCLTVVARAQVQHEIDEDLDQLADRDDRDPGEGAGSR